MWQTTSRRTDGWTDRQNWITIIARNPRSLIVKIKVVHSHIYTLRKKGRIGQSDTLCLWEHITNSAFRLSLRSVHPVRPIDQNLNFSGNISRCTWKWQYGTIWSREVKDQGHTEADWNFESAATDFFLKLSHRLGLGRYLGGHLRKTSSSSLTHATDVKVWDLLSGGNW